MIKVLRIPQATFGVIDIMLTILAAVFAPLIIPVSPEEMDFDNLLSGISSEHLLFHSVTQEALDYKTVSDQPLLW